MKGQAQKHQLLGVPHGFRLKFNDPIHYISSTYSLTAMFISIINLPLHKLKANSVLLDIAM